MLVNSPWEYTPDGGMNGILQHQQTSTSTDFQRTDKLAMQMMCQMQQDESSLTKTWVHKCSVAGYIQAPRANSAQHHVLQWMHCSSILHHILFQLCQVCASRTDEMANTWSVECCCRQPMLLWLFQLLSDSVDCWLWTQDMVDPVGSGVFCYRVQGFLLMFLSIRLVAMTWMVCLSGPWSWSQPVSLLAVHQSLGGHWYWIQVQVAHHELVCSALPWISAETQSTSSSSREMYFHSRKHSVLTGMTCHWVNECHLEFRCEMWLHTLHISQRHWPVYGQAWTQHTSLVGLNQTPCEDFLHLLWSWTLPAFVVLMAMEDFPGLSRLAIFYADHVWVEPGFPRVIQNPGVTAPVETHWHLNLTNQDMLKPAPDAVSSSVDNGPCSLQHQDAPQQPLSQAGLG